MLIKNFEKKILNFLDFNLFDTASLIGVVRLKLKSEGKVGITDRHMYHIHNIFFFFFFVREICPEKRCSIEHLRALSYFFLFLFNTIWKFLKLCVFSLNIKEVIQYCWSVSIYYFMNFNHQYLQIFFLIFL